MTPPVQNGVDATVSNGTSNGANGSGKRPIYVAGCSGGVYDRKRAIHDMAKVSFVDFYEDNKG